MESFHSRFRNDCLYRELFLNLLDAQVVIGDWRVKYNHRRPHSGIAYRSPVEVFQASLPSVDPATGNAAVEKGALPPDPRDLSLCGIPAGSVLKTVESIKLSARRTCTAAGAQVASLQSPILRDSLTTPEPSTLELNPINQSCQINSRTGPFVGSGHDETREGSQAFERRRGIWAGSPVTARAGRRRRGSVATELAIRRAGCRRSSDAVEACACGAGRRKIRTDDR